MKSVICFIGVLLLISSCNNGHIQKSELGNHQPKDTIVEGDTIRIPDRRAVLIHNEAISDFVKNPTKQQREEAISKFNEAISIDPLFELAYYHKMQYLLELERDQEALSVADSCIIHNPRNGANYLQKGMIMRWMGNNGNDEFTKAVSLTRQELAATPSAKSKFRLLYNIALAKSFLGEKDTYLELDAHEEEFRQLFQDEGYQETWKQLVELLKHFNEREALEQFLLRGF